jgi:hypothetical protein
VGLLNKLGPYKRINLEEVESFKVSLPIPRQGTKFITASETAARPTTLLQDESQSASGQESYMEVQFPDLELNFNWEFEKEGESKARGTREERRWVAD